MAIMMGGRPTGFFFISARASETTYDVCHGCERVNTVNKTATMMAFAFLLFAASLDTRAWGQDFEGWCYPDSGEFGFHLPIEPGKENARPAEAGCTMTSPVPIRGMSAILYDTKCNFDGAKYPPYREMLVRTQDGALLLSGDSPDGLVGVVRLVRCDAPIQ
jgi:hypothetical protein